MNRRKVQVLALTAALIPAIGAVSALAMQPTTEVNAAPPTSANKILSSHVLPDLRLGAVQNGVLPGSILNDRGNMLGGLSDLFPAEEDGEFWTITDRGPVGTVTAPRRFGTPTFTPLMMRIRVKNGAIQVKEVIPVTGRSGKGVTGLPNTTFDEAPIDCAGAAIPRNPSGLDTEGIVRTKRGDFWVVDEHTPSVVKIDKRGRVVTRLVPNAPTITSQLATADYPISPSLPTIFEKRKRNRGFEGISLSPNGKTMTVVLQSPLLVPTTATGNASRNTRVLVIDVATEKVVGEYVYRFQPSAEFGTADPTEMKLSAVAAIDKDTLLILERTDLVAKVYKVELKTATNILGGKYDNAATTPSLESLDDAGLLANGVKVLPKELVFDGSQPVAGGTVPGKIEGLAILDDDTIAISNDTDFDITSDADVCAHVSHGAKSQVLIIKLAKSLDGDGDGHDDEEDDD